MTKDEKLRNLRRACRRAGWSNYVIREAERGSKRRVFAWSTSAKHSRTALLKTKGHKFPAACGLSIQELARMRAARRYRPADDRSMAGLGAL